GEVEILAGVMVLSAAGDGEDLHAGVKLPEPRDGLHPGHLRHEEVEHDHVCPFARIGGEARGPALRLVHVVAGAAQDRSDGLAYIRVVIDHQQLGHDAPGGETTDSPNRSMALGRAQGRAAPRGARPAGTSTRGDAYASILMSVLGTAMQAR